MRRSTASAVAGDLLLRQRVAPFDEAEHKLSDFRRPQVLPLLHPFRMIGEVWVLYRIAKPS